MRVQLTVESVDCRSVECPVVGQRPEGGDNLLNNAFGYGVHIGSDIVRGSERQWAKAYCPLEMIYCGKGSKFGCHGVIYWQREDSLERTIIYILSTS